MNNSKHFFQNLDALRFLAAAVIVLTHIEQYKSYSYLPNNWQSSLWQLSYMFIALFFVLSGFLTANNFLSNNSISPILFYKRRAKRIFPLYFLLLVLTFFVFPCFDILKIQAEEPVSEHFVGKLVLSLLFFPDVVLCLYSAVPYFAHTWFLGALEHILFFFPLIFKYARKHLFLVFTGLFVGYLAVGFLFKIFDSEKFLWSLLFDLWHFVRVDCVSIGALFAIIIHKKHAVLKILCSNYIFYPILLLIFILMGYCVHIPYFMHTTWAVLFGLVIINLSVRDNYKLLDNALVHRLARWSYGLYIWHPLCIVLSIRILNNLRCMNDFLLYFIVFFFSLLLAAVSYTIVEKPFIQKQIR